MEQCQSERGMNMERAANTLNADQHELRLMLMWCAVVVKSVDGLASGGSVDVFKLIEK